MNASYELRTPLALNRALAELAVTRPGAAEDTVRLGEALLSVNERHERIIDALLTLADSETAVLDPVPVDLADVVRAVLHTPVAREAAHRTGTGPGAGRHRPARARGPQPPRQRRPLQPTGRLGARADRAGRRRPRVGDRHQHRPDVPAHEVETIFEPFRRLGDRNRAGSDRGFGLGLAIGRAVASAHGGAATAGPRAGGGLVVALTLPRAPVVGGATRTGPAPEAASSFVRARTCRDPSPGSVSASSRQDNCWRM